MESVRAKTVTCLLFHLSFISCNDVPQEAQGNESIFIKSAKEFLSQTESVLVVKNATYTHSVKVNTSDFFVETIPTFSEENPLDY